MTHGEGVTASDAGVPGGGEEPDLRAVLSRVVESIVDTGFFPDTAERVLVGHADGRVDSLPSAEARLP